MSAQHRQSRGLAAFLGLLCVAACENTSDVIGAVPELPGSASVKVVGLGSVVPHGGVLSFENSSDPASRIGYQVPANGEGSIDDVPPGLYGITYAPPALYRMTATDSVNRSVLVTSGQTSTVSFSVELQPPPTPADRSIPIQLTRLDGGSGAVLVSNGIPLRPGDIFPEDVDNLRILVGGVEQPIFAEGLRGKHPDGSLRSVLVQLELTVDSGSPIDGAFEFGPNIVRQTTDRAKVIPPSMPAAVALPTRASYLVKTGFTIHPVMTEEQAIPVLAGTAMEPAFSVFRQASDDHWNAYGADWSKTTYVYDRALNHYTFWAMTGEVEYWRRATLNALESLTKSTDDPQSVGVSPRFYQPDGFAMHYWLTGDVRSLEYLVGGVTRTSVIGIHRPPNLYAFGLPPNDHPSAEGRIRARVLLGALYSWLLEDTSQDWAKIADDIVAGMISGQNSDGSFTWILGNANTAPEDIRWGQSNFMEGMAMEALIKYYHLRAPNPQIVTLIQGQVDFLAGEWSDEFQSWHYWSPSAAYDIGDSKTRLDWSDGLSSLITVGHYFADYVTGDARNEAAADAAIAQGWVGADFGTTWGKKLLNQWYHSLFAQMYYRSWEPGQDPPDDDEPEVEQPPN